VSKKIGTEPEQAHDVDGRHQRSERSRERVLDAIYAAFRDSDVEVTAEQVAARARVSLSTIRRHFGDLRSLSEAMRERMLGRVLPLLRAPAPAGSRKERVRALVARRREVFELVMPGLRATSLRAPGALVRARADRQQLESALRAQLLLTFPGELAGAWGAVRAELLSTVLSLASWEHLRTVRELDPERCIALLEHAARALLGAAPASR
jgi:AcrR family transcriptional regulator